MKRLGLILLIVTCSLLTVLAQETEIELAANDLYSISADTGAQVQVIRRELESRFEVFNRLFRFDPDLLDAPLNVRVFSETEAYEHYLNEHLEEIRAGAAYLHYDEIERRQLLIDISALNEEAVFMLDHQAFVQFFRAFVPNPPPWMLEGFAIYFSEDLLWLGAAKGLALPSTERIMSDEIPELSHRDFQIASWALVSFLRHGFELDGGYYFRTLNDSFLLLSPSASTAENTEAVLRRFALWNDFDTMDSHFKSYMDSTQTLHKLMEDGQMAYSQGDLHNASINFLTAMEQYPLAYAPYYFMGLISHDQEYHYLAERYFIASLETGADEALVNYALGINALAGGRTEDATAFLVRAAAIDPARYQARLLEMLRQMQ